MTVGWFRRYAVLLSLSLLPGISETALDEQVSIRKVVGDKAILLRGDRAFYLVQMSAACPSLAHQEGGTVLVRSPDGFLGPQSGLVLGGGKQPRRIARAAALLSNAAPGVDNASGTDYLAIDQPQMLMALQEALMLLGRDPGTVGSKVEAMKGINKIRRQYGNVATPERAEENCRADGVQVISRNPNDDRAKGVSLKLLNMALGPDSSKIHP